MDQLTNADIEARVKYVVAGVDALVEELQAEYRRCRVAKDDILAEFIAAQKEQAGMLFTGEWATRSEVYEDRMAEITWGLRMIRHAGQGKDRER